MKRKSPPPKKAHAPPPNPMKRSVIKPMISSSSSQSERTSRPSSSSSSQPVETSRPSSSASLQSEKTPSPSSSHLQAEKTPPLSSSSIPAEKAPAPAPARARIKNVIPRYLQRPTPDDMTPEEWCKRNEFLDRLRKLPRSQWELEDLLWTFPEYHFNEISKEEGLQRMKVVKKYYKQIEDSQGFDCDYTPEMVLPPGHIFKLDCTKRFLRTSMKDLALYALKSYNRKCKPRQFEVLEVQKVNTTDDVCRTYYLTFTAKDVSSRYGSTKVFQACVFTPWGYVNKKNAKPKVELCRMKPRSVLSMALRG